MDDDDDIELLTLEAQFFLRICCTPGVRKCWSEQVLEGLWVNGRVDRGRGRLWNVPYPFFQNMVGIPFEFDLTLSVTPVLAQPNPTKQCRVSPLCLVYRVSQLFFGICGTGKLC